MKRIVALLLWSLIFTFSFGQSYIEAYPPHTLPNTEVRILHSQSNGITYKIYIALPENYSKESAAKFPVLYLLDADYSFPIAKSICDHLFERDNLPPVILVGIAYAGPNQYQINRTRDYTPLASQQEGYSPEVQKHSGGGPKFLSFIESELMPFIEKNFRTSSVRGICGHSYGGLFASWVMLTKPKLFSKYIIVSPSLWYESRFMFGLEDQVAKANTSIQGKVYMAAGDQENPRMATDLQEMVNKLKSRNYSGLQINSLVVPGENHNTVFPIALTKGLRFVFP
jgi:uncharacterized protein